MNRNQEKLLVAALAGLIIAGAAAFAVQPAFAEGYYVESPAQVTGVADDDVLNVRRWPASYSEKIGGIEPDSFVWVTRCIVKDETADWCLIETGDQQGWVNSSFLEIAFDTDI